MPLCFERKLSAITRRVLMNDTRQHSVFNEPYFEAERRKSSQESTAGTSLRFDSKMAIMRK